MRALIIIWLLLTGAAFAQPASEPEEMVSGLDHPWSFAFLPDFPETGAMLITERPGALRLFENGHLSAPLSGAPEVAARGQGGLLDVALSHDFAESGVIYLSYAAADGSLARTEVARARLIREDPPRLEDLRVIFRQSPSKPGGRHFGSRIVVADDGSLFVTLGERGDRPEAQNLAAHQGKIIRITPEGAPHPANPFLNQPGAAPEIWSYGHRNPQGAALGPDGALWITEHGARGGDEVNQPRAGVNHGWPVISYGRHYSGEKIGEGTEKEGMAQPKWYWDPSIAPSGLAFWRGKLAAGSLKFGQIALLDMEDGEITGETRLFRGEYGRIRDLRAGPDGALWFATDEKRGAIWRVR